MKKINYLLSALAMSSVVMLSSCGGDKPAPVVSLSSTFLSVMPGDEISITVTMNGENKLKSLDVTETTDLGGATSVTLANNDESYTYTVTAPSASSLDGETITVTFTVTDKDDVTSSADLTIYINTTTISEAKLLGAQAASAGSFYSTREELVYSSGTAKDNPDKVDVSFAEIGATVADALPKLISPDYRDEEGMSEFLGGSITYFALSTLDFEGATDAEINAIAASSTKSIAVEVGKVYEFVNAKGDKGLILIENYSTGADDAKLDGELTIKVRRQLI